MAKKAKVMQLEEPKETKLVSKEVENIANTPLTVVKFGKKWKVCLRNNIISLHEFDNVDDAKKYGSRMDSVDVINAVLILLNNQ